MKRIIKLLIILGVLSIHSCGKKEQKITNLDMLKGEKTFAVPTGTAADQLTLKRIPDGKIKYFNSVLDCALAVKEGKADAAVYDLPVLKNIAAKNEGLMVLSELLLDDQYGFAVQLGNVSLKTAIDEVQTELRANGKYDDMMKRWFPEKGGPAPMPQIVTENKNGILKFGTAAVTEPIAYYDSNRKLAGFDIEFASYIAQKLGKQLEVIDMEFGAMLPALIAGKVELIGAGISITEERAKKVLFSNSYYKSGIAAIVRETGENQSSNSKTKLTGIEDVKKSRIGVLLGSVHDNYATKNFPEAIISQYQNRPDLLTALNLGKVDVAFTDQSAVKDILDKNRELASFIDRLYMVPIAAGFNKSDQTLRDQFNVFLKKIKSDGTYNDLIDRWIKRGVSIMPEISTPNTNGSLRVGCVADIGLPTSTILDGKLVGFDIEIAKRFAAFIGKEFVPIDMPFGSLLASISTNKIDIITSSLMVSEERKKKIDFSDPYFESGVSLLARKSNIARHTVNQLSQLSDIAHKKVGILNGTVHDGLMREKYPEAEVFRYNSTSDMIISLTGEKVDAIMLSMVSANVLIRQNPDLGILSTEVLDMPLGVGFNKKNPELREKFNNFLKTARQDSTYATIYKRWMVDDAENAEMPPFNNPPNGKKLVVGVSVDDLPYVAFKNGGYVGFDIELIQKFAEKENFNLELISMDFSSLIAALAAGKVAMISDGMAITKERSKEIDFSDSYADFKTAVMVLNKNLANSNNKTVVVEESSFAQKVSNSFYNNIILEKRYLLILDGLKITMIISLFAAIFGTMIGGLICFMRMAKQKWLSVSARLYINLLRGTPVLVLLMIIYYVVFASVNINPVLVAVIAFGLNFGAYVSEMFRTSIESLDKGQKEAAIAGGFTKIQTFVYIILPQALRHVLPVYKGEFISLIKMTSIVGYIAVQDLTKASDIIRSRTFDAFFPLIMVAVFYLAIAWVFSWALGYVEISVDPKRKQIKKIGEEI